MSTSAAGDLVLNPFARIRAVYDGSDLVGYNVRAPVRGIPLRSEFIDRAAERAVFDLLRQLQTADADIDVDAGAPSWARLRDLGFFVPEPSVPEDVRYALDVRQAPASLAGDASADAAWVVSPTLVVQESAELPPAIAARVPHLPPMFEGQLPLVWVEDPRTRALAPYHVDADVVRRLSPSQPPPALDADLARALRATGILVPRDAAPADFDGHAAELAAEGMTRMGGFIPPVHLAWMRAYYRRRLAHGYVKLFVKNEEKRYIDHNEPIARFWLTQLASIVARVTRAAVKPSYVFFASYVDGSALRWHVDRPQCEYSMSLLVDYSPAPEHGALSPWPLLVERRDGAIVKVHQRLGDALVYRGRQRPHARPELPVGHTSTSLFLHFVDESFGGPLK